MLSRQVFRSVRTAAPRLSQTSTRTFAAAASTSENVKAPVAVYGLDGTYATALVRPLPYSINPTQLSRLHSFPQATPSSPHPPANKSLFPPRPPS